MKKSSYDRESFVKRYNIEREQTMPEVEKELDVVPVEDAMAISSNEEKRALLLEQLKKDLQSNYKVVLSAGSDGDSESAHYVAAAKMEVYRRKHAQLQSWKKKVKEEPGNAKILKRYLKELEEFIESELLAEREAQLYKVQYCEEFKKLEGMGENGLTKEEYGCYLTYLVDLKQYEKAQTFWKNCNQSEKNETAYRKILQMYYEMRDEQKFYQCLDSLQTSGIKLSLEGRKLLHYWAERRE